MTTPAEDLDSWFKREIVVHEEALERYLLRAWPHAQDVFDLRRYSTPVGVFASLPLQDGSKITLDTRTQVRVDLSNTERRVDLDRGEAYFEVAKDPRRSFVVRAGRERIIALGTQFSVRRNGDDVRVVVTEGSVRLESEDAPLRVDFAGHDPNFSGATPGAIRLSAGTVARTRNHDLLVQSEPLPKAREILSWRQGYHKDSAAAKADQYKRWDDLKARPRCGDEAAVASP
jgi:transmembrane sensor